MLSVVGKSKLNGYSVRRYITLFSQAHSSSTRQLVFPFRSNVVDDCGVTLSITDNKMSSVASLKESIVPFQGSSYKYQLKPKTSFCIDSGITHLANIIDSINSSFIKINCLLALNYTMEFMPKLFSWREYYAIAEFTAINLLNHGNIDRAIQLINNMPTIALNAYNLDTIHVDSIYLSVNEVLAIAYIIKGDLNCAEKIIDKLIFSLSNRNIEHFEARALSIKAIICYLKNDCDTCIKLQKQAIELLNDTNNSALRAVTTYDLWVFYKTKNDDKFADESLKSLENLLSKMNNPSLNTIKAYIKQLINHEASPHQEIGNFSSKI